MHFPSSTAVLAAVAALSLAAAASPLRSGLLPRQANSSEPCAAVAEAASSSNLTAPLVNAKLAYDCLNTIPLNATSAEELINSIEPYIRWQSTLAYLKDPPAEYAEKVQGPVDVYEGLNQILQKVRGGGFKSEYEFGWELYRLFQSTHDGHFVYVPDSVGSVFTFGRPISLVSISEDGSKLPGVYAYPDILQASFTNSTYEPSAITQINGQDASEYLEELSQYGSLQDRDALYNNLFYSLAQVSLGPAGSGVGSFAGGGRGRFVYPGPETVFKFANGTERSFENFARVLIGLEGIQTGKDIAEKYFLYSASAEEVQIQKETFNAVNSQTGKQGLLTKRQQRPAPPGYPTPVVSTPGNIIGGYYIDQQGYEDVAVLAVPNFVANSGQSKLFQNAGDQFLARSKADGKKKLVIDLSANGGGTILQGYDLFKKLFPSLLPYGASRFRAHEAVDLIGQAISDFSAEFPRDPEFENSTVVQLVSTYFNYRTDADENYEPFESWADKYGPVDSYGDKFTSLSRWNLSDPLIVINSGGIEITGYGGRANVTTQPFESKDIVIVYDGYCASTCTIFSELMRTQGNVTTVALGGRAQQGPQQAVGGVKGTNVYPWGYLQLLGQTAIQLGAPNETTLNVFYDEVPFARAAVNPSSNSRDGIRQGDDSLTPLQFVYEPADCRLFYTAEMTTDVTAIWKAVADSKWGGYGGVSKCVASGKYYGHGDTRRGLARAPAVSTRAGIVRRTPHYDPAGRTLEALADSLSLSTDLTDGDVDVFGFMMP